MLVNGVDRTDVGKQAVVVNNAKNVAAVQLNSDVPFVGQLVLDGTVHHLIVTAAAEQKNRDRENEHEGHLVLYPM